MDINEITVGELKHIAELAKGLTGGCGSANKTPFVVGEKYLIRSVTNYHTGRVKAVVGDFLVLENAAWIGSTGRFHNALKTGELSEVEPIIGDAFIAIGAVVDAEEWAHDLPSEVL